MIKPRNGSEREMDSIRDTEYTGRRGVVEDITKRHPNLISTEDEINRIIWLREDP